MTAPWQSLLVGAFRPRIGADNLQLVFEVLEFQRDLAFQSHASLHQLLKLYCVPKMPRQFGHLLDKTDVAQRGRLEKSSP